MAVKFGAGDQKPVTPFSEVFCRVNVPPAQIGAMEVNVGKIEAVVW